MIAKPDHGRGRCGRYSARHSSLIAKHAVALFQEIRLNVPYNCKFCDLERVTVDADANIGLALISQRTGILEL